MPSADDSFRYRAADSAPAKILLGQGFQHAILCVSPIVLVTLVVFRSGADDSTVLWAVFASLVTCGLATMVQGVGLPGIGARAVILHNSAALFIAVCVAALAAGGTALLATLMLFSAVTQIVLSARLSMLRRVLTPTVLAGLAGTVPNTTYLVSISVIELTGVAARAVATVAGAAFIALAFLPKALAVVLAIPAPVMAASVMMTMVLLFVNGLREVVASGLDVRNGLIVGVSFWAGVAFENDWVFPEYFTDFAGGILASGMSAGCLAAMALTLLAEAAKPRRRRLRCRFDIGELPRINNFLADFANRSHWPSAMAARLQAAAEEALLTLGRHGEAQGAATEGRGLVLTAYREDGGAVLEVVASADADNLQDRIAVLGEEPV